MRNTYFVIGIAIIILFVSFLIIESNKKSAPLVTPTVISTTTTTTRATIGSPVSTTTTTSTELRIVSLSPASGTPGTTVTIKGTGFDKTSNMILFGNSYGRVHLDGSPDNRISDVGSSEGNTLTFNVPNSGPSGILCSSPSNHCIGITAMLLQPKKYTVQVKNKNGTSNIIEFTLTVNSKVLNK